MLRILIPIIALLIVACVSHHKIYKAMMRDGAEGAAQFFTITEYKDTCWVHDTTGMFYHIRCKNHLIQPEEKSNE